MHSVQQGSFTPVFVAVVYRSPHVGFYSNKFDDHLRACGGEFGHRIIMGDLNADLIKPNAETRVQINLVEEHSLKIIQHGPTHHTRTATTTSDTHIDVILVDTNDKVLNFDKYPAPYSKNGHDVITSTIELFVVEPTKLSFRYRDYKSVSPEALMTTLPDCDWSHFQSSEIELHIALECFNMNLTTVLDKLAPLKTVKPAKGYEPWVDSELIGLRRKRDAALRQYLLTKLNGLNDEYAHLRDEYNARYEEARNSFMQTRIAHTLGSNSNGVWR